MFFNDQLFLRWTSEIRCVFFPKDIHISKKMHEVKKSKSQKVKKFHLTAYNKAYHDVVRACSESRKDFTWLTSERMASSFELHELGFAHSVEVWQDEKLIGGLFGISFGSFFYPESMFARVKSSSKVAFTALCIRLKEMNYSILDCGIWPTDHLKSLGAVIISRDEFLEILDQNVQTPDIVEDWRELFENWDFSLAVENFIVSGTREKRSQI